MTKSARRLCGHPGCYRLAINEFGPPRCENHQQQQRPKDTRPSAAARGYGYRWQQASKAYLASHPLCVECEREGAVRAAQHVDHIMPHEGDMTKFWDETNWQGLCVAHHNRKTQHERR